MGSVSSEPSSVATTMLSLRGSWIHDPDDAEGTIHHFRFNNEGGTEVFDPDLSMMSFAGRVLPVAEFGDSEVRSLSVRIDLADPGDVEAMRRLTESRKTICYRDGFGRKLFGILPGRTMGTRFFGGTVTVEIRETEEP